MILMFFLCQIGPINAAPPYLEDQDFDNLESTLPEVAYTQVTTFWPI